MNTHPIVRCLDCSKPSTLVLHWQFGIWFICGVCWEGFVDRIKKLPEGKYELV